MERVPLGDIAAIEINISCPNRKGFDSTFAIIDRARGEVGPSTKLGLKINNGFNLDTLSHLPLDFITYSNTLPHVHESFGPGGLSGNPLKDLVKRQLGKVRSKFTGTLIACGGVKTSQDYQEYLNLGADYVGLASQYLKNKEVVFNILSGL
jgi:dihydroorotate dehydrogenase